MVHLHLITLMRSVSKQSGLENFNHDFVTLTITLHECLGEQVSGPDYTGTIYVVESHHIET